MTNPEFRPIRLIPISALLVLLPIVGLPAATIAAEPIIIGMAEAKLLEQKGPPESKASMREKTIYRWADAEVVMRDGYVETVRLRDAKLEKQLAQNRKKSVEKQKAETIRSAAKTKKQDQVQANDAEKASLMSKAREAYVEILDTDSNGALVAFLNPHTIASHLASIGGGGGVGPTTYHRNGNLGYVEGFTACTIGDRFNLKVAKRPSASFAITGRSVAIWFFYESKPLR